MRVVSYNVHGCVGADGRFDAARTVRVIGQLQSDVLGLQEVDSRAGQHADAFAALARGSGLHAVAGPNIQAARGQYGNMLLSRWPPVAVRRLDLSVGRREPRGLLDVDLDTPEGRLRVLVTHLGLFPRERQAQIARLRAVLGRHQAPRTVVLGDLNVARWRGPDLFGHQASDGGAAPRTFPSRLPMLALDRIQVSPPRVLLGLHAHASPLARQASDHLPLVAELRAPRVA